jgi:hypothetical protein
MPANNNVPNPSGYADRVVTKAPDWHSLVVFDVLFSNLTTGLFLVAAVGELAAPSTFTAVATWAYPIALALLLVDLALLVLDLGDPLRFHHMLRVFKPSSPMSLGTWCLTIYSLFLTVIVVIEFVVGVGWLAGDSGFAGSPGIRALRGGHASWRSSAGCRSRSGRRHIRACCSVRLPSRVGRTPAGWADTSSTQRSCWAARNWCPCRS